jgi:hypothetical protein
LQAVQRDLESTMSREERAVLASRLAEDEIAMELAKQSLDQWRQAKPGNQSSWFLRLVLGRVNYQLWKKTDRVNITAQPRPLMRSGRDG